MTPQPAKPRVLIVDDHPTNRLAFEMLLAPLYTVALAGDGREALDQARKHDFAVILLDVRMPGMDGYEVAEILRKDDRTRYTPIVFMSAYDRTDFHARKGYIAGATDYIFSPVDVELLKYKVSTYVQIYLRNEALWTRVLQLQETVRDLQRQLDQDYPIEQVQRELRSLENQVAGLKAQLDPVPT